MALAVSYHRPHGEGSRAWLFGQRVTLIASAAETGGALEAAIAESEAGTHVPAHHHTTGHECLLVLDGAIDLRLDGRRHHLTRGSFASIPPGTVHACQSRHEVTRVLTWSVGGALSALLQALGTDLATQERPAVGLRADQLPLAEAECDITFERDAAASETGETVVRAPGRLSPYVLAAHTGEHMAAAEQLFTFLADSASTADRFLVLATAGPKGAATPLHFHEQHTETFFCLEGRMTMWLDEKEVVCGPGGFVHVPPGTVHAYRLDDRMNRFVGLLSPGLFEPFFRTLCDPVDGAMPPSQPGPLRLDRVLERLSDFDLKIVAH